jgi:hypothetical protein
LTLREEAVGILEGGGGGISGLKRKEGAGGWKIDPLGNVQHHNLFEIMGLKFEVIRYISTQFSKKKKA